MSVKSKNKRFGLCLMVVTASLVLAALWAGLTTPETALAKPPAKEKVLFDVTTDLGSDMMIVGTLNSDGTPNLSGSAEGRADNTAGSQVIVNRPAAVMEMAFLDVLADFENYVSKGYFYKGTLVIQQNNKGARNTIYFFKGTCKNWVDGDKLTGYRIDATATIASGDEDNFPVGGDYTVILSNIELSVDTGSRKNGHEGPFPDASATVRLDRIQ